MLASVLLWPAPAHASIDCVQQALAALGYEPGQTDGLLGPKTASASRNFAADHGVTLAPLTAANSQAWCNQLRRIALGAGAGPVAPRLLETGAPQGTPAPLCTIDPPEGYAREIRGMVDGDLLTLRVSSRFGGAVESARWRDKEFINIYDHGRQISYAWGMDGYGECLNPTEPGSASDLFAQTSTSRLKSVCSDAPNRVTTITVPAFWLRPGESGFCARGARTAVNASALTAQTLRKTIEIGYRGIDGVIAFDATVTLDRDYRNNQLEVPTAYLTADFTEFRLFNPQSGEVTVPVSQPLHAPWSFEHVGKLPVIIATPDGALAMGAYSADPLEYYSILRYDVANPADRTSKWNMVAREEPAPAGDYRYRTFAIVGSLATVQQAMRRLYVMHPTDFDPPEGFIDAANCAEIAGWAWDPKAPDQPVEVDVYDVTGENQHTLLVTVTAGLARPDLPPVLGDNGRHGYAIAIGEVLPGPGRYVLAVEAANSVAGLPNRPLTPSAVTLECR